MEETHKGKSQKPSPKLTKEKVNKSKLGNRLVKATTPCNQKKANHKTKKTTTKQVKGQINLSKMTLWSSWTWRQKIHGGGGS
jgi:hypothetical protein